MLKQVIINKLLPGWKKYIVSLALGLLSSLCLPPYNLWVILFITIPGIIITLDAIKLRQVNVKNKFLSAIFTGWLFGFGYFLLSLYWIGEAFMVNPELHGWMKPLAITALPAGLAVFFSLTFVFCIYFWKQKASRIFTLAISILIFEWLRGHILTGFPWNLLGHTVIDIYPLSQIAAYTGTYSLSFIVVIIAASPILFLDQNKKTIHYFTTTVMVTIWLLCIGNYHTKQKAIKVKKTNIKIIQANIEQNKKWKPEYREMVFKKYSDLSQKNIEEEESLIIWPESALPILINYQQQKLEFIKEMIPKNTRLITGIVRYKEVSEGFDKLYNSLIILDSNGKIVDYYDKTHLVPFGEYLPLKNILSLFNIDKLVEFPNDFYSGKNKKTIHISNIPSFSPVICYEIIFPNTLYKNNIERPNWILNITNDAWFGNTPGPKQHLIQARFRAIEEGLPIIRAANTGISAIIDAHGNILNKIDFGKEGIINGYIPPYLPKTIYAHFGDLILVIMILSGITIKVLVGFLIKKLKNTKNNI